jgi:hypothetical protein
MRLAIFLPSRSAGARTPALTFAATTSSRDERLESATIRGLRPPIAASSTVLGVVVQNSAFSARSASWASRPAVHLPPLRG